jgi:hypothetical protein
MLPTPRTGVATTAAPDFITAPIMGMGAIIERGMAAPAIGMTARGVSTVREVAPPTGMMDPEVPADGVEAPPHGIMARVISADIAAVRRTGAAAQEARPDGAAAPHPGVAGLARFTELEVAPARGGVKLRTSSREAPLAGTPSVAFQTG